MIEHYPTYVSMDNQTGFFSKPLLKYFFLCLCKQSSSTLVMLILESLLGVNAIISYAFDLGPNYYLYCYGITNFIACLINVTCVIDRISRRINTIFGILLNVVILIVLALFKQRGGNHDFQAVLCAFYMASFELSFGALVWTLCVELLPFKHFSFSTSINWFFNVLVIYFVKVSSL